MTPRNIDEWLATATRGLEPQIRERLKIELASHFYDSYDDLVRAGELEKDALQKALAALGDVQAARQTYRDHYALAAPWLVADFPPRKPLDEDYGYLKGNELIPCTREELIERCRKSDNSITLAWMPDSEKLQPIEQIPFLFEAIKEGRIKAARDSIWMGLANIVWLIPPNNTLSGPWRHVLLWVAFFGLAPFLSVMAWRKARALTPELIAKQIDHWEVTHWLAIRKAPLSAGASLLTFLTGLTGLISYAVTSQFELLVGLTRLLVLHGEWWRLLTAAASPDLITFFIVIAGFLVYGRIIELVLGPTILALVFMSSVFTGSLFTIALDREMLMGASGGIFGMLGLLAALRTNERFLQDLKPTVTRLLVIGAVAGIIGFDILFNAAHLGGLLCGLAWAWALQKPEKLTRNKTAQLLAAISVGCFAAGSIGAILILLLNMMR